MKANLGKKTRVGNRTGITSTTKEAVSEDITTVMTPVTLLRVHAIVTNQVEEGHVIAIIQGIEKNTTEDTHLQIAKTRTEGKKIKKAVTAGGKLIHPINILGTRALKSLIGGQSKKEDHIQTKKKKRCGNCTPTSRSESWHKPKPSQTSMNTAMNFSGMGSSG